MATQRITTGIRNRVSVAAWRAERRQLCKTPTNMLVTAIVLLRMNGPEGRKLYGGPVPKGALRRTLALADRLEREAKIWENERRLQRNAARRVDDRKEPARVAA